jgi:putative transcriptional regulator
MSIHHHPSDDHLLAYAAGTLPESWALAVATHAAMCPDCRAAIDAAERVGGVLLDDVAPVRMDNDALDRVLARIEGTAGDTPAETARGTADIALPQPLRGYVERSGGMHWRRLGLGIRQIELATSDDANARLLRIAAGLPVPAHSHRGDEFTLVLDGGFSDATGHFGPGDLQLADDDLTHRPVADPGRDCICLAVTRAPLRFESLAVRMLQPILGI